MIHAPPQPVFPLEDADHRFSRADLPRRWLAFLVDGLVVGLLAWGLGAMGLPYRLPWGDDGAPGGALLIATIYFGIMHSRITGGRTVGKALTGLRVARVDGRAVGLPRSFLRVAVLALPGLAADVPVRASTPHEMIAWQVLLALPGVIAFVMILSDRVARRGLHDVVAGTFVVRAHTIRGLRNFNPEVAAARAVPRRVAVACTVLVLLGAATPWALSCVQQGETPATLWDHLVRAHRLSERIEESPAVSSARVWFFDDHRRSGAVAVDVAVTVAPGAGLEEAARGAFDAVVLMSPEFPAAGPAVLSFGILDSPADPVVKRTWRAPLPIWQASHVVDPDAPRTHPPEDMGSPLEPQHACTFCH